MNHDEKAALMREQNRRAFDNIAKRFDQLIEGLIIKQEKRDTPLPTAHRRSA